MQNSQSAPQSCAASPRVPEIIFANWRERLNQLKLARSVRHIYAQAIEGCLDYCRLNGVSVVVETARGFVSDALRRARSDAPHLGRTAHGGSVKMRTCVSDNGGFIVDKKLSCRCCLSKVQQILVLVTAS